MIASRGVIGYNPLREWIYVHTEGARCAELVLTDSDADLPLHLRLHDSMASISFRQLDTDTAEFVTKDIRENYEVNLAGAVAGSHWHVLINGKPGTTTASPEGLLRFRLNGESVVNVSPAGKQNSITQVRER